MPIYAYRCSVCGHAKDVLQKLSDAPLSLCPSCGAETFLKQVTAAGFQLKGSGWYVTDFRGGNSGGAPAAEPAQGDAPKAESPKTEPAKNETSKAESPKTEASSPAPAPPSGGSGAGN